MLRRCRPFGRNRSVVLKIEYRLQEGALDENADMSDAESINSNDVLGAKSATNSSVNGSPQKYNKIQIEPKQIIQSYPHYHRSIPRNIITNYATLPTNSTSHGAQFNHNARAQTGQHSTYSRGKGPSIE